MKLKRQSRLTYTRRVSMRTDRRFDETRNVRITDHYLMSPQGSVLIEMGNTKVICTASVEDSTAKHLTGTGKGWVTAEYAMLPGSTGTRKKREKGKPDGRSCLLYTSQHVNQAFHQTDWIQIFPGQHRHHCFQHHAYLSHRSDLSKAESRPGTGRGLVPGHRDLSAGAGLDHNAV